MTDNLVKRLRKQFSIDETMQRPNFVATVYQSERDEAADRIEQLEAALRDAYGDCLDAVNKIKTDALTDVAVHQRIAHTTTLTAKDFMIAIAEDIEREIKARAALGEKKDD